MVFNDNLSNREFPIDPMTSLPKSIPGHPWITAALALTASALAAPTAPASWIERFVAIDNVCAWPNLTLLNDGSIAAVIHNQPSHSQLMGDLDCWVSRDGNFWEKRGQPTPNDPGTVRMNVAAGKTKDGSLV